MPTTLCGPTLPKFNSLRSMPTSQLSCLVQPFENAIVLDQCQLPCVVRPFENRIVPDQCQLPCVVRPFENSILFDQYQLLCVVGPFENSIVFGQCPHPNCLLYCSSGCSRCITHTLQSKMRFGYVKVRLPNTSSEHRSWTINFNGPHRHSRRQISRWGLDTTTG